MTNQNHLCNHGAMDVGTLCFLNVPCYLLVPVGVVSSDAAAIIWEILWDLNTIISE